MRYLRSLVIGLVWEGSMKILLLEDDPTLNKTITQYLQSTGHQIESFREGKSALKELQEKVYDLVILDINVPYMDGLTLLEKIYHDKITPPAIFISALIDIEEISRAFELGCYDYLKKPFHLKELSLRIDKMLQTHHAPQVHTRLSEGYSFDANTSKLYFYNQPQILPNRQLEILKLLTAHRGNTVSYDLLRYDIWDSDEIDNSTIRAEVSRLKKNLKEDFIINIRSIGYMVDRIR